MITLVRLTESVGCRWQYLPGCCRWFVGCVGTALVLGIAGGILGG